jgi:hypothetical protein
MQLTDINTWFIPDQAGFQRAAMYGVPLGIRASSGPMWRGGEHNAHKQKIANCAACTHKRAPTGTPGR